MFQQTTATKKVAALTKRIRAVQGGTSASKTISILLLLIAAAQADKKATLTSIVSESFPHLKRGAIRDFLNILEAHGYYKDERWNKTDYTYTFETGSKIEFFSADQPGKVRGPRRDRLFLNEANNIPYETFDQLEVRTKDVIFLDWNPSNDFWFYTEVLGKRNDVDHITLTYLDNEGLDPAIIKAIEARKDNLRWWKVYGLGELGDAEGKIYRDWSILDEIPHEARLERRGLDFGYTVDPSCLIDVYRWNGALILDEQLYQKGMSNREIAEYIKNLSQQTLVIADSAEPKSIDEIRLYGIQILGSVKGQGSVLQGIQAVQDQRIFVTKRSVNVLREYRNYFWLKDKEGRMLQTPDHLYSHSMDAIRYAVQSMIGREEDNDEELRIY